MIQMRGKRVGVELPSKHKNQGVLYMPEDTNAVGIIRYLGSDLSNTDLAVGMKVYFGDRRQPVTIDGATILVMDEDNILAVVKEDVDATQALKS